MIPPQTIQQILETARIEDVVQDYVTLKRRGVNMIGLCPFHHEKTPSFTVSPSRNIFKCFGCGKGGDPVRFIMEHNHLSYPEALRYLAQKYNIEIREIEQTPEIIARQKQEESLYIINEYAQQFYQDQLFNTDFGRSIGLNYFKSRGFREDTIRRFGLGFATNERDAFTQKALKAGYQKQYLQKLGLTTQHDRDFFRNRVIFAIHGISGKVVAFAGRILEKDPNQPKYINSLESDIYVKNKVLYGAFFAKNAIRKADECILVEGYTDVISLHQAGIENVVASSGTSLTEGQINLIRRFTSNITILYDGDPAGIKAALRGLDLVLEHNMNVKVVLLPDNEDPDSYLYRIGAAAFQRYIAENAKDFILFKTDLLLKEVQHDPVRKAALLRDIVDSIARIPDPFKRTFYIKECARIMDIQEEILVRETNKSVAQHLQKNQSEKSKKPDIKLHIASESEQTHTPPAPNQNQLTEPAAASVASPTSKTSYFFYQERDIARILITGGDKYYDEKEGLTIAEFVLGNIVDVIDNFEEPLYKKIAQESLQCFYNHQKLTPRYFITHPDEEIRALAIDFLQTPWEYSPGWNERELFLKSQKMPEENFHKDSLMALQHFKLRKIIRHCEENQQKLIEAQKANNAGEILHLIKVQNQLNELRRQLAKALGIVVLK